MKSISSIILLISLFCLLPIHSAFGCLPPVPVLNVEPQYADVNQLVTLDGSESYDPIIGGGTNPGGLNDKGIRRIEWDLDNNGTTDEWEEYLVGSSEDSNVDGKIKKYFEQEGEKKIKIKVKDLSGIWSTGWTEKTVYVQKILYVDANAISGTNKGTSWANAFTSLQDALDVAQPGHQIWVAKGTYYPDEDSQPPYHTDNSRSETFQLKEGVEIYGGFAGGVYGETSLNQRDLALNKTILSGDIDEDDNGPIPDANNCYHVVTGASDSLIDGFIITGGVCDGNDSLFGGGGMLNNYANDVQVINCTFTCNNAGADANGTSNYHGGAMYNKDSTITMTNCLFHGNSSAELNNFDMGDGELNIDYGNGGAVYITGSTSSIDLINCTLSNNVGGNGGGICLDSGTLNIDNSIIWNNRDSNGIDESAQVHITSGTATMNYSCINNGWSGTGSDNIYTEPNFVELGNWGEAALPNSILLNATIRDFKKGYDANGVPISIGHPDFERPQGSCSYCITYGLDEDLVRPTLGFDKTPIYDPNGDQKHNIASTSSFYQWYHDDPNVNRSIEIGLMAVYDPIEEVYVFSDLDFFPIDNQLFGNDGDPNHNYHFTLELHSQFTYNSEDEQFLQLFKSDDDIWVFINNQLVVDLGGIHDGRCGQLEFFTDSNNKGNARVTVYDNNDTCIEDYTKTINLGLVDSNTYDIDIFFAERHTSESRFSFWTNIKLENNYTPGDYHLQPGSPCIDAGDNTAFYGIEADIDGLPRFIDDPNSDDDGHRDANDTRPYIDMGAYEFQANSPPDANAGQDQTYYVCSSSESVYVTLDGSGSTDPDSNTPPNYEDDIVTYLWSWMEGENERFEEGKVVNNVVMSNQYSPYTVTLTVIDSAGFSDEDTMYVTIQTSDSPVANLGNTPLLIYDGRDGDGDGLINAGADVTLDGSDSNGADLYYIWYYRSKILAQGYEETAKSITTRLGIGTHTIGLRVIDQCYEWDDEEIEVIVKWPPTTKASIDAGEPQDIWLPLKNAVQIHGKDTPELDPNDVIKNYKWRVVSLPLNGEVSWPDGNNILEPNIVLAEGVTGKYIFELIGKDINDVNVAWDLTSITVHSISNAEPNAAAWINVGSNRPNQYTAPMGQLELGGTIADDGLPFGKLTGEWIALSGPTGGVQFSPMTKDCDISCTNIEMPTVATFTKWGDYIIALRGYDGLLDDQALIAVNIDEPNFTFSVDAGSDHVVYLPAKGKLEGKIYGDGINSADLRWYLIDAPADTVIDANYKEQNIIADPNGSFLEPAEVTFNSPGEYRIKLVGKLGVFTDSDIITIVVRYSENLIDGGEHHSLIVDRDGGVWSFGRNGLYELGLGSSPKPAWAIVPSRVVTNINGTAYLENIKAISAGEQHSLAINNDGKVWSWGSDLNNCLGNGDEAYRTYADIVLAGESDSNPDSQLSNVIAVACGRSGTHSLAIAKDHRVLSWGTNDCDQLGLGDITDYNKSKPCYVLDTDGEGHLQNIVAISAGANHSMALEKLDTQNGLYGRVFTFGYDQYCLGIGNSSINVGLAQIVVDADRDGPFNGRTSSGPELKNIVGVAAGWHHSMALEKIDSDDSNCNGRVYVWGSLLNNNVNTGLYLGDGYTITNSGFDTGSVVPVMVVTDINTITHTITPLENIIAISAGEAHCMALEEKSKGGHVWTWGSNKKNNSNTGQLGRGPNPEDLYDYFGVLPKKVVAPDIYDSNGLPIPDGQPDNLDGDPNTRDYLGDDIPIVAIAAGYWHCLAMDEQGRIFAWGYNGEGRLGIGTMTDSNVPRLIAPLGIKAEIDRDGTKYSSIKKALQNAKNGDTIIVYATTHRENINLDDIAEPNLRNLDYITIRSIDPNNTKVVASTIVSSKLDNPSPVGSVFTLNSKHITIEGLTITNGTVGISCAGGNYNIRNCIITNNEGDGITCGSGTHLVENCKILYNKNDGLSTGDFIYAKIDIRNNLVYENKYNGMYIYTGIADVNILNNTIVNNGSETSVEYYGINYGYPPTKPQIIKNCIFWGNLDGDLHNIDYDDINYCGVQYEASGPNNIQVFGNYFIDANTPEGCHLALKVDDLINPCIDAGDPYYVLEPNETDIDGTSRIFGEAIDIGCDEVQAIELFAGEDKEIEISTTEPYEAVLRLDDCNVTHKGLQIEMRDVYYQWKIVSDNLEPEPDITYLDPNQSQPAQPYAEVTFYADGDYLLFLRAIDKISKRVIAWDYLGVTVKKGVEIEVVGKEPISPPDVEIPVYQAYVGEDINLTAHFGPNEWPPNIEWWAPYDAALLTSHNTPETTISFQAPGTYPVMLRAMDNWVMYTLGEDMVWIQVKYPQVDVSAGPDRTLYLSQSTPGEWEVNDLFIGTVSGINANEYEWQVTPANEHADTDYVYIDCNNCSHTKISFAHHGAYFVKFTAQKDDTVVGSGISTVYVEYPQIVLDAGNYNDIDANEGQAQLQLHGTIVQGSVDSVEWAFLDPNAPAGLVTFTNPRSLNATVSFNPVDVGATHYSGGGSYTLTLLGKINIDGNEEVAEYSNVDVNVSIIGSSGVTFKRVIAIQVTQEDVPDGGLPCSFAISAAITDANSGAPFRDYDTALWSWSGTDNSIVINQPNPFDPNASVTINQYGQDYKLYITLKKDNKPIGTASLTFSKMPDTTCSITAHAGFDPNRTVKNIYNIEVGEAVDLYGYIENGCSDINTIAYWYYDGDNSDVTITPKIGQPAGHVNARAVFKKGGNFPLQFRIFNKDTSELICGETIFADVNVPIYGLHITGEQYGYLNQNGTATLPLTATMIGNFAGKTTSCTWFIEDQNVTPNDYTADSGETVDFTFTAPGTYNFTVTGNVNETGWSHSVDVTVDIMPYEEVTWCAGTDKHIILPNPAYMTDALFKSNVPTIIPKWALTDPCEANVSFSPDENTEKPNVNFTQPGKYTLSLVPWDVDEQNQVPNTLASTVDVYVNIPSVQILGDPNINFTVSTGDSNNLRVLRIEARDDDGVAWIQLEHNGQIVSSVSGAPTFPSGDVPLVLVYTVDVTHLADGNHVYTAYAWDTGGNCATDSNIITNNYAIRNFHVEPEIIDDSTGDDLNFYASFASTPEWVLSIEKGGASFADTCGTDGNGLIATIPTTPIEDWPNGQYKATLSIDPNTKGQVNFKIMRGESYTFELTAELDSFDGENTESKPLTEQWTAEDFVVQQGQPLDISKLPIPRIKDGFGTISARLGNADFPDDIEFRLQACVVGDNGWLIPVKILTSSDFPHDSAGWASITADGTSLISLGTVDLSTLDNGVYYFELSVRQKGDTSGRFETDYAQFILDCPLKIGNLKFSQEDLVVETGGIPLRVIRTYDSFNKHQNGEFGYGWTNSIADMDFEFDESRTEMYYSEISDNWGDTESIRFGGDSTNRNVTLTLPDGRRTTFMFYYKYRGWDMYGSSGPYYSAEFAPMEGLNAALRTLDEETAKVDIVQGETTWMRGIAGGSLSANNPSTYDFSGYVLTTEDGTEYCFERKRISPYNGDWVSFYNYDPIGYWTMVYGKPYLTKIRTIDGEEVQFERDFYSPNGQISSINYKDANGVKRPDGLQIIYNSQGRISHIYAPADVNLPNPTLKYEYDNSGNLIMVSKLIDQDAGEYEETRYEYDDNRYDPQDHYVTAIKDERGLMPIQYVYDASGRLIETIDAKGNRIAIEHGGIVNGYKAEMVYERWDVNKEFPTVYAYNDRGNVVFVQKNDASGSTTDKLEETIYTYGDSDYPDGPSEVKQWLGGDDYATTTYRYDSFGHNILTVDPNGNATTTKYDGYGNVIETIQSKNYNIDTDFNDIVSITLNGYDGNKLRYTEIQDVNDKTLDMTMNFYDELNRLVNTAKIDVSVMSPAEFNTARNPQTDEIGELPQSDKHSITTYHYSGNELQPEWIEDAAGAKTYFAYDENGRQEYSYYIWTDPAGIDPNNYYVFNVNVYDSLGRVIQTEQIVDNEKPYAGDYDIRVLSRTEYNKAGKVDFSISDSNNLVKYEYDQLGSVVETRTYNIGAIGWSDTESIASYISDSDNILTISRTLYDTEGRAFISVGPYEPNIYQQAASFWPVGTETVYDVLGRTVETRRWAGVKIDLVPFKVSPGGQVVQCAENDTNKVGKMPPMGIEPCNALLYSGAVSENIGWWSNNKLPVVYTSLESNEIGPLSYSKTLYDHAGRVLHSVSLDEDGVEQVTSYEYDASGRQIAVIDPLGHDVNNLYTTGIRLNNATITNATTINFASFDLSNFTGSHRTDTYYDGTRRDCVVDALGNTTLFKYDSLGRVITTVYPPAAFQGSSGEQNTYSHTEYDGLGRKSFESQQTAEANPDNATGKTFEYDLAGRLTKVILPDVNEGTPEYRYFYDTFGNMAGILDAENRMTVFEYDEFNRQIYKYMPFAFTDPTGGEITLTDIYNAKDAADPDFEETYYDELGRVGYTADYKEQISGYEYDSRGRLAYKKYFENYDDYDANEPNATIQYTYDRLGRKKQVIDSRHGTTTYYYDAEGRIIEVAAPEGTIGYEYNSITGQKIRTYSQRTDTYYSYDELGRLAEVTADSNTVSYGYDAAGNRDYMELDLDGTIGFEIKTDYTYDNMNRLTDIIHKKTDQTILSSYQYLSKANGSRHSLAEFLNSENRNITYGYDELNRLVSEDANDANDDGYSAVYEYDLAGNRLSREVTANNQGLRTEYQYYEGTDRLYKEIHTGFAARLDSGNESYYAYADSTGGFYYKDSSGKVVGAIRAFFAGLPSKLSGWLFGIVSVSLIIVFFVPNLLMRRSRHRLSFFHRGMCILIACIMFISPEGINLLSEGAVQYSQIGRSSWGQAGKEITYEYDDNGSVTKKTTLPISEQYPYERVYYTYDLANRLIQVKTEVSDNPTKYVVYTYNDDGIRVRAYSYDKNGSIITNKKTTVYLIDSFNHTGYAQSLEELTFLKANPNLQTDTPRSGRKYVIGDDVISQQSWVLSTISSPRYLLYDGHGSAALTTGGSTRQLAYYTGTDVTIADSYSYDGYGVLLQNESVAASNPGKVLSTSISTNLLYAGEQFDTNSQQYYLRARWYNPLSGLFNQLDQYAGNTSDPQSLHKYLYCHANPVNATDPSGKFIGGIADCISTALIRATLYVMDNGPKLFAYTWAAFKITGAMWLATMSLLILQELGVLPHDELVAEIGAILGLVLITELFVLTMIPTSFASPPKQPRGMNDPRIKQAVNVGIRAHYDKTTDATRYTHEGCPTQLKRIYNQNTEFWFAKRGQAGPDVKWISGPHPSTYPNSKWPTGINQADFKPDTPTGNAFKLPPNTLRIPYDPQTGQIKH